MCRKNLPDNTYSVTVDDSSDNNSRINSLSLCVNEGGFPKRKFPLYFQIPTNVSVLDNLSWQL